MNIGIVIAVDKELKSFLESDFILDTINLNNRSVYHTVINGNNVYALRSGAGVIDAASATQLLISKFDCSMIMNFGVTGALVEDIKVSDLFVVTKCLNHDFDTSQIDPVRPHQYDSYSDQFIPLDAGLIKKVKTMHPELKEAVVASGDSFIGLKSTKFYLSGIGCNICDMEIAAIARVCDLNNCKAISFKCISDEYDGDGSDFIKNVTNSANKAFAIMKDFLLSI